MSESQGTSFSRLAGKPAVLEHNNMHSYVIAGTVLLKCTACTKGRN